MEHDEKCELVDFASALQDYLKLMFSRQDWHTLRNTTHPMICCCRLRAKKGGFTLGPQVFDKMYQNFALTVANKNLGVPMRGQFDVQHPSLSQSSRGEEGRVIEVDFRNRRRLT